MKYYLVGIKGTGMSSLAIVLKKLNHYVIGSDVEEKYFTDDILKEYDINIKTFNKDNIYDNGFCYIIGNCYNEENIEVKEIIERKYKYYYYNDFINDFFKCKKIGVSGSHGKTTTASFLADAFENNITAIIGNGRAEADIDYEYLIVEACEYKDHFLKLNYDYLIINNIDFDHTDYFKDLNSVYNSFIKAANLSENIIVNDKIDIEHKNKYTFGEKEDSFCNYKIIEENDKGYILLIKVGSIKEKVHYPFYGIHMIENLLAALTVLYINGMVYNIQYVIDKLNMPRKRMEEYKYKDNIIINDYAHHPTEIKALLKGIKQKYSNKKIIVFFQPHTYTRTISLEKEFKECFKDADRVYIDKTFTSKRERHNEELEWKVKEIFKDFSIFSVNILDEYKNDDNNVLLFLGAGVISDYIKNLLEKR